MEIDRANAWVCPTEQCRERQISWKRVDLGGNLMYLPVPLQVELHEAIASQDYGAICIGGHRGSSKSIAVRHVLYNACLDERKPEFIALLFRRLLTDLYLNQGIFFEREAQRIGAKYSSKSVFFEKTNSLIIFGHSKDEDDYKKYIGGDVHLIVLEQIEEFLHKQVVEINAATGRSTKYEKWRGLLLATENPGGPLSDFVNAIWVRKDLDRKKYPKYNPSDYHFIEAHLEDNPWVDARYDQKLALLSPARREMMRYGRRDIFEGQYWDDFIREVHVIADRPLVRSMVFRSMQFGYHREGFVLWLTVETNRHITVVGVLPLEKLNEDQVAARVAKMDRELNVRPDFTVANPEIFGHDPSDEGFHGETIAETLAANGCPVICGDPDLVSGWKRVHSCLRIAPDSLPWLRVHESCEPLIAALQNAMSHKEKPDDISADSPNLNALHALRLAVMTRPAPEHAAQNVIYPVDSAGWMLARAKAEARKRAS